MVEDGGPNEQAQLLRDRLREGAPERGELMVEPSDTYLGVPLGCAEAGATWGRLMAKWRG